MSFDKNKKEFLKLENFLWYFFSELIIKKIIEKKIKQFLFSLFFKIESSVYRKLDLFIMHKEFFFYQIY